MSKRDPWPKDRTHGTHFSNEEIALIREWYDADKPPIDVARELQAAERTIQTWYTRFRNGWEPGQNLRRGSMHMTGYTEPVPKRPMPAPNALPWCLSKLRAGRA